MSKKLIELTKLIGNVTEAIVDSEIRDDIPIVSIISGFMKISYSMKIRKYVEFFSGGFRNKEEGMKFYKDHGHECDQRFGEDIIIAIDRVENIEKAGMIGKLAKNLVLNIINIDIITTPILVRNITFLLSILSDKLPNGH